MPKEPWFVPKRTHSIPAGFSVSTHFHWVRWDESAYELRDFDMEGPPFDYHCIVCTHQPCTCSNVRESEDSNGSGEHRQWKSGPVDLEYAALEMMSPEARDCGCCAPKKPAAQTGV
jgi:hypothetical protein